RKTVEALDASEGMRILDLATGTADLALAVAKRWEANVVGTDPSANMLAIGREKVSARDLENSVELVLGDAQAIEFEANSFDGCCMAFGIRNVPDRGRALREMARVVKTGRPVAILELGEPRSGVLGPLARFHVHHVVPRIGAWLSGSKEYRYLQQSIEAFPPPEAFIEQMEEAGLRDAAFETLTFGVAHLYVASAP
ncbi:MAG: ubiquinone/menaquinone biosynthesis methyltransferase, partial [Myxococcota bacterium]